MNALTVLSSEIRQLDGLYSLNDLHKASGGAEKHRPNQYMRLDTTKALIVEINNCADQRSSATKSIQGCRGGTYVCKELVYAYAMWISPSFHLKVIRAFDAMQGQSTSSDPLPLGAFVTMHAATQSLAGQRFLVTFNDDGTGYSAKAVPSDSCVMTVKQFAKAIGDPNGLYIDTSTLADMIVNCARHIERRVRV